MAKTSFYAESTPYEALEAPNEYAATAAASAAAALASQTAAAAAASAAAAQAAEDQLAFKAQVFN
jgi:hypothetical protein